MALSGALLSADLIGQLGAAGFVGPQMPSFTIALGTGMVAATVGKSFATVDVGSTPGAGAGIGTGLTGLVSSVGKGAMIVEALSKGFIPTPQADSFYGAVASAYVIHLALATLTSTHAPVYLGSGTVTSGSISISKSYASGIIFPIGAGLGMLGAKWVDICDIVGAGMEAMIVSATGAVVITGGGGPPVPGGGAGSGVIS